MEELTNNKEQDPEKIWKELDADSTGYIWHAKEQLPQSPLLGGLSNFTQKMVEEKFQIVLAYQIYIDDWKKDGPRYKAFELFLKKFPQFAFDLVYPHDEEQFKSVMQRFPHKNKMYHINGLVYN